eukprot:462428-Prorocentrum_minimum.AAC.2
MLNSEKEMTREPAPISPTNPSGNVNPELVPPKDLPCEICSSTRSEKVMLVCDKCDRGFRSPRIRIWTLGCCDPTVRSDRIGARGVVARRVVAKRAGRICERQFPRA